MPSPSTQSASPPMAWVGSLKLKRKFELQQLCRELGIDFRTDALKAELEHDIRVRLSSKPTLQTDPRYFGLIYEGSPSTTSPSPVIPNSDSEGETTIPKVLVKRTRGASKLGGDDSDRQADLMDTPPPTRNNSTRRSLPPSSARSTRDEIVTAVKVVEKSASQALSKATTAIAQETSHASDLAKRSGARAKASLHDLKDRTHLHTISLINRIQTGLSSPWAVSISCVIAELVFVIHATVPAKSVLPQLEDYLSQLASFFGPLKALLSSQTFWYPLARYIGLTIILPLVLASLMNVPSGRRPGRVDLKPDVFVYNSVRMGVLGVLHWVVMPGYRFGWNGRLGPVQAGVRGTEGLEGVQVIGTALGFVMALHQIVTSPRRR